MTERIRRVFFLSLLVSFTSYGWALAVSTGECSAVIDGTRLKAQVLNGRVYQHENFLSEEEVRLLLKDMDGMREANQMVASGLSNTNKGKEQNFGENDRTVAPTPWWNDSLKGGKISLEGGSDDDSKTLNGISGKIQALRSEVALLLDRPTMKDSSYEHECYHSRSAVGASLNRHLDEFHEETKGPRGWVLPSRRSVSWLIYLSDEDIEGGELRSFVQKQFTSIPGEVEVGSNQGNLQVGWLDVEDETFPVYLDSWFKPQNLPPESVEQFCILYTIVDGNQVYITRPWVNMMDQSFSSLLKRQKETNDLGLFVNENIQAGFKLIEDRSAWENGLDPEGSAIEDYIPKRGSLVMFDSVAVPHEVLAVKSGVRPALAGWFHEQTQQIPEGFY